MHAINKGLCALLVGAATLGGCDHKGASKEAALVYSSDSLEMMTQQVPQAIAKEAVVPAQNTFTNTEGEYSLMHSPQDYGFALENRLEDSELHYYQDVYDASFGALTIFGIAKDMPLQEAYDNNFEHSGLTLMNALTMQLEPGAGIQIRTRGPEKRFSVNGLQGMEGGTEFWMYAGTDDDYAKERNDYIGKTTLRCAVAHGRGNLYLFNMIYEQDGGENDRRANQLFDDILESFRPLK